MSSDDEKVVGDNRVESVEEHEEFSPSEQRSILRRADIRLVGATALGYSISLMDRGNISLAAIAGMLVDLDLSASRYSLVVLVFFIPYVLFQPPATVLTRKLGPPVFLSLIVLCWGVLMIGVGFAKSFGQIIAVRVLLGVFAAGYFPGCVYLLSSWYTRYEVQKRFSVFYGIGVVASAIAGILSFGLSQMNGTQGLAGWRWIFILEGVITCVIGFAAYVLIVDFPDRAHRSWRFLSEKECSFMIRRIDRDRADAEAQPFSLDRFLKPALDLKIWGFAVIFGCLTINTYAMSYFLAIILSEGLGFGVGVSQCLTAAPWTFAAIMMFLTALVGDKYHTRAPLLVFNAMVSIVGLSLMGFTTSTGSRLVGVFLTVAGANANVPAAMAWQANNVRGQWSRAFSSASLVAFDGIGGIIASEVFQKDAPRYRPGVWVALASNILILIIVALLTLWFRHCNKQADRGKRVIEGSEIFRYTI